MITLLLAAAASVAVPEPQLQPLLERARVQLADARTLGDLQVCAPEKVSRDGQRYTVMVAFSRLNQPRRFYGAIYRDGRLNRLVDTGLSGDTQAGLMGLAAGAVARRFEKCRWVSRAELDGAWAEIDAQ